MFDTSLAFRKIKPNVYAFIPGYAYTSKAYFVTTEEKIELEKVLRMFTQHVLATTGVGALPAIYNPIIAIITSFLVFFWGYYKYKRNVKKIIGNRKKQPCKRMNLITWTRKLADSYSWKDIIKVAFICLIILPTAAYVVSHYNNESNTGDSIAFVLITFLSVGGALAIISIAIQKYILQKRRSKE